MELNPNNKQESDFPKGLAKPALRALANHGLWRLEQVAKLSEMELKKLHGIGPNAMKQLRLALEDKGLTFSNE
ncbi:DNA-binding protein [Paenibacillus sp. FA6]|uniref:DNA-binding protein n=1 Tax=Paenibacillus sp. FA6 TaxID=3413029 RepID=UPI003F65FEBF